MHKPPSKGSQVETLIRAGLENSAIATRVGVSLTYVRQIRRLMKFKAEVAKAK